MAIGEWNILIKTEIILFFTKKISLQLSVDCKSSDICLHESRKYGEDTRSNSVL